MNKGFQLFDFQSYQQSYQQKFFCLFFRHSEKLYRWRSRQERIRRATWSSASPCFGAFLGYQLGYHSHFSWQPTCQPACQPTLVFLDTSMDTNPHFLAYQFCVPVQQGHFLVNHDVNHANRNVTNICIKCCQHLPLPAPRSIPAPPRPVGICPVFRRFPHHPPRCPPAMP